MSRELVSKAKAVLSENSYDSLHNASHSELVWNNCRTIVLKEGLSCQMDALEVAAWWHDVDRKDGSIKTLKDALKQVEIDEDKRRLIINAISEHSFGNTQTSTESKVLYDADKLEYLSLGRFLSLLDGVREGEINKEKFDYYKNEWRKRIVKVRESLNYESTKLEFDKRLSDIKDISNEDASLRDMVSGVI